MKRMNHKPAFTLLELMVALVLFTIGMLSVVQIFPANRRLLNQTASLTQATFLAQEQLEMAVASDYDALTSGTYLSRAPVISDQTSPFYAYEREVLVAYINGSTHAVSGTETGLKRIRVNIYWLDRGVQRTYSLSTYVTR